MNKKRISIILIILGIVVILILGILGILFTEFGEQARMYMYDKIFVKKEKIILDEYDKSTITCTYSKAGKIFSVDINDTELNNLIINEISNKKLSNYSNQILLDILGEYTVYLSDNVYFKFDGYEKKGYIRLYSSEKNFLTMINPEILSKIKEVVEKNY